METMLIYIIKVNMALVLLYALYKLLFTKHTFLHTRRWLLLSFYLIAFTYSFIHVPEWIVMRQTDPTRFIAELVGQEQNIQVATDNRLLPAAKSPISWLYLMTGIYLFGVIAITARSALEIRKTYIAIRKSKKIIIDNTTLYCHPTEQNSYSFFNWIFINPDLYTAQEFGEILAHEQTHVRQGHSYDIILAQLVTILCWPNPFAWLLRSEMKLNHEYLADKEVVNSGYNKIDYQYHLIGISHPLTAAANLNNNFSVLPLKNRIKMMNRKRTKSIMQSKLLMLIPALAILIAFTNSIGARNNPVLQEAPITANADQVNATDQKTEPIVDKPDKLAEYPGGVAEFMKYLNENLKYPEKAMKDGTKGRVVVQFIVHKDGTRSDYKIVRSINKELDDEALRVLKEMPKWTPAIHEEKAVASRYIIPIVFRMK